MACDRAMHFYFTMSWVLIYSIHVFAIGRLGRKGHNAMRFKALLTLGRRSQIELAQTAKMPCSHTLFTCAKLLISFSAFRKFKMKACEVHGGAVKQHALSFMCAQCIHKHWLLFMACCIV